MTMTDPIADLFTRIRNAGTANRKKVDIPHSSMKESIARLLVREGFLNEVQVSEVDKFKRIRAYLKMDQDGGSVIQRIERMSKPGRRVYHPSREIPKVLRGMGLENLEKSEKALDELAQKGMAPDES